MINKINEKMFAFTPKPGNLMRLILSNHSEEISGE